MLKNYPGPIEYNVLLSGICEPFSKPLQVPHDPIFLMWHVPGAEIFGGGTTELWIWLANGYVLIDCRRGVKKWDGVWICPIEDPDIIKKAQAELRSFGVK